LSTKFFQPGDAPDPAYRNLRDLGERCDYRAFCEALWPRFEPYADPHFLKEVRRQFHPRFWEMYLAVAFLERGYTLHKHRDGGPEFGIDLDGTRFWFDAIAPTAGSGPDAVPRLEYGKSEASRVPQEQIILRITSALDAKRAKWVKDLKSGRISAHDGYIVAINDRSIREAWLGSDMPYVVKALYGFGDIAVSFDRKTLQVVEAKYLHRPTVSKVSGTGISSQPFAARECPEISAVLYSSVDAANFPRSLGGDFMILHNDRPTVPLGHGTLRFAREYWLDEESLQMRNWSATPSPIQEA